MSSENRSQDMQKKKNSYLEQESQKVRVFISELKCRLDALKVEEERIEKVSVTLFKKHNSGPPFEDKHTPSPEQTLKIQNLRKEVWKSEENPNSDDKNGFHNTLKMFQDLQYSQFDPDEKEHEEITRLKQANLCIKKKIEILQAYIEKAKSNKEVTQQDTCSQLYQATEDTLRKISELDDDIRDVASILSGTGKSCPRSKDGFGESSGKSLNENVQPTKNQINQNSSQTSSERPIENDPTTN